MGMYVFVGDWNPGKKRQFYTHVYKKKNEKKKKMCTLVPIFLTIYLLSVMYQSVTRKLWDVVD